MNQGAAESQIDDLLSLFLEARSEAESEAVLEQLIVKHAQPLIRDIIGFFASGRHRRAPGIADVANEVIVRLIARCATTKVSRW